MLLCWESKYGHCWIKWRLEGIFKLSKVIPLALSQDHLWWWHSWQTPSYPGLTALVPVPVQLILFSTNLRNRWLFPLCESLLKTYVSPSGFFWLSSNSVNLSSEVMFSLSSVILSTLLWTWVHIFPGAWGPKLEIAQSEAKEFQSKVERLCDSSCWHNSLV